MRDRRQVRIVHLPTSVGNVANSLSRELTRLGFLSSTIVLYDDQRFETADIVVARRAHSAFGVEIRKLLALSYVFHCEIVVFNFGSTLFNPAAVSPQSERLSKLNFSGPKTRLLLTIWRLYTSLMQRVELSLLRLRRVKMIVIYQGDDIRQKRKEIDPTETSLETMGPEQYFDPDLDKLKAKQGMLMGRYAHGIFALNPDLLLFLPPTARFLPYFHVPLEDLIPRYPSFSSEVLRFAHAPTNRDVKGTHFIIAAVNQLKLEGHAVELDLIENRTQAQALEAIARCDVYLDQLIVGWYGGVAVEAMGLGKPVVGFLSDKALAYCPAEIRDNIPIIQSSPTEITQSLRELAQTHRFQLSELGRQAREFSNEHHCSSEVVRGLVERLEIKPPLWL